MEQTLSLGHQEGTTPADTLILDVWLPELWASASVVKLQSL